MKKGRGAAAVLTNRQANVLGAVGEKCWNCGHYALSIDAIADEALVSHRTVHRALHAARALGLLDAAPCSGVRHATLQSVAL